MLLTPAHRIGFLIDQHFVEFFGVELFHHQFEELAQTREFLHVDREAIGRNALTDEFGLKGLRDALFQGRVVIDQQHLGFFARFGRLGQRRHTQARQVARIVFHAHAQHEHVARKASRLHVHKGRLDVLREHETGHLGLRGDAAGALLALFTFWARRALFGGGLFSFDLRLHRLLGLAGQRGGVLAGLTQRAFRFNFFARHRRRFVKLDFVERHEGQGQITEFGDLIDRAPIQGTDGDLGPGLCGGLKLRDGRAVRARTHEQNPHRML